MLRDQLKKIQSALKRIESFSPAIKPLLNNLQQELAKKDPLVGDVNYYAPDAETQIATQKKILQQWLDTLNTLRAAIVTSNYLQHQLNSASAANQIILKAKIATIQAQTTISDILTKNPEVAQTLAFMEQVDKKQLTKLSNAFELAICKEILAAADCDPKYQSIYEKIWYLSKVIVRKTAQYMELPKGMLDIKRVLIIRNMQKKFPKQECCFCVPGYESTEHNIVTKLDELKLFMANVSSTYQALAIAGGYINEQLHQTTSYYWESLYAYSYMLRDLQQEINASKTKGILSATGLLAYECINQAVLDLPAPNIMLEGLQAVKIVDEDIDKLKAGYRFAGGFFARRALDLIKDLPGKVCYLPANNSRDTLDNPRDKDYSRSGGNCHGEAMMFLKHINYHQKLKSICPGSDLLTFQFEPNKTFAGHKPQQLGNSIIKNKTDKNPKIGWEDINSLLNAPINAPNGDVCILYLGGLEFGPNTISHNIGIIRLIQPARYVLFDYNIGTIICEQKEALEQYFHMSLNMFTPYGFKTAKFTKYADATTACKNFINGIKPVTTSQEHLESPVVREKWSGQLKVILAKYGDKTAVQEILNSLVEFSPVQRAKIYTALQDNKNIHLEQVLLETKIASPVILKELITTFSPAFSLENKIYFVAKNCKYKNLAQVCDATLLRACQEKKAQLAQIIYGKFYNDLTIIIPASPRFSFTELRNIVYQRFHLYNLDIAEQDVSFFDLYRRDTIRNDAELKSQYAHNNRNTICLSVFHQNRTIRETQNQVMFRSYSPTPMNHHVFFPRQPGIGRIKITINYDNQLESITIPHSNYPFRFNDLQEMVYASLKPRLSDRPIDLEQFKQDFILRDSNHCELWDDDSLKESLDRLLKAHIPISLSVAHKSPVLSM